MSPLNIDDARALLVRVVQGLYDKRHSPVPGALVKAHLISEAAKQNSAFSERAYGLKNFLEFVRTSRDISVQIRIGSDMLLAPATAGELLSAYARPLPRLRRDFWRAFIEFPIAGTIRLYDMTEDKIVVEQSPTMRKGIVIEPISRETQIAWRKTFAEEQPESLKGPLLGSLDGAGTTIFNEFARRLRENPATMHAWNQFLQKQITDHVEAWASANEVSEERWCSGTSGSDDGKAESMPTKTHSVGQRAEPVNPAWRNRPAEQKGIHPWKGAQGLADDVRYYGQWMRDRAEERIGHLYPDVEVTPEMAAERPDLQPYVGRKLKVIAWLWARTVKSPNPAFADVDVPLASTFMLSTRAGKEAYVEPVIENGGYRFTVKVGKPDDAEVARNGTKLSRGANFRCVMSEAPIAPER